MELAIMACVGVHTGEECDYDLFKFFCEWFSYFVVCLMQSKIFVYVAKRSYISDGR